MAEYLESLCATVQNNCHISDARHAGDYSLCVYLLKMREYYRWEKGYPYSVPLSSEDVGGWLKEREHLWEALEDRAFEPLTLDDHRFDPFDAESINRVLLPKGYVYSGGLGSQAKPHFFLGRLERREAHGAFTILVAAEEFARDLTAPPAMNLGNTVFVRRQSLRRMVWEKVEEWRWDRRDNAMGRAVAYYDFEKNLERALDEMAANELETVLLHEIGEAMAGERLGDDWNALLAQLPRSRAEFMARAVRDHLADCLSTLPELMVQGNPASLHFYFANLSGMRKELFPTLFDAYQKWWADGDTRPLKELVEVGRDHWIDTARSVLDLYREHGQECIPRLDALLDRSKL